MNQESLHVGFETSEYIIPPHHLDGGLATYIQKVSRGLVQRGHRVSVFCLSNRNYDWVDQGVRVYEVLASSNDLLRGLNSITLPTSEIDRTFTNSSLLAQKLLQINIKEPLDVVQAASYQAVGIAMCNNGRIPLITRVSSLEPLYRNAGAVGKNVNPLSTVLTDWCVNYQMENSDRTFSPSALMAKYYSLFSQATPMIIRSPIDIYNQNQDESFYDQHLKGRKYLLFFGTLNRLKGIEIISKSLGGLIEEFPDLHFVFIGRTKLAGNNESFADNIMHDNERWRGNIHYFPSQPKQTLYPVIRHAHGVLVPSLVDNYPNTCLEAMQFGKIVIGTFESSLDEMIVDGETGILVQKNDVESLQTGIRMLLGFSITQKCDMERRILNVFNEIESEDRIGQLLDLYHAAIIAFRSSKKEDPYHWDGLLMRAKFRKDLRVGILPGIILKISQKLKNSWKPPLFFRKK